MYVLLLQIIYTKKKNLYKTISLNILVVITTTCTNIYIIVIKTVTIIINTISRYPLIIRSSLAFV